MSLGTNKTNKATYQKADYKRQLWIVSTVQTKKKEIVKIVLPLLNEVAKIDKKTLIIDEIIVKQKDFSEMLNYFIAMFPETIILSNMEIKGGSIKISGDAANAQHLQTFYTLLKRDNKFKSVSLQNIKKTETGYNFLMFLEKFTNI